MKQVYPNLTFALRGFKVKKLHPSDTIPSRDTSKANNNDLLMAWRIAVRKWCLIPASYLRFQVQAEGCTYSMRKKKKKGKFLYYPHERTHIRTHTHIWRFFHLRRAVKTPYVLCSHLLMKLTHIQNIALQANFYRYVAVEIKRNFYRIFQPRPRNRQLDNLNSKEENDANVSLFTMYTSIYTYIGWSYPAEKSSRWRR